MDSRGKSSHNRQESLITRQRLPKLIRESATKSRPPAGRRRGASLRRRVAAGEYGGVRAHQRSLVQAARAARPVQCQIGERLRAARSSSRVSVAGAARRRAGQMDGHPRQNPAYRLANGEARGAEALRGLPPFSAEVRRGRRSGAAIAVWADVRGGPGSDTLPLWTSSLH